MVLLAFRHGLRASELVDLRWEQVDLENAILHVRRDTCSSQRHSALASAKVAIVGAFYSRKSSGNLAKFTACVPGQTWIKI
jgi:site-specific recombinase XerC